MSESNPPSADEKRQATVVTELLSLGLAKRRPIDRVIERLGEPDAAEWIAASLIKPPFSSSDIVFTQGDHALELDSLVRLKDEAKRMVNKGDGADDHTRGLLGYFFAVAFGLALHDRMISSYPPDTVRASLVDLAGVMPDPWRSTFETAVERAMAMD